MSEEATPEAREQIFAAERERIADYLQTRAEKLERRAAGASTETRRDMVERELELREAAEAITELSDERLNDERLGKLEEYLAELKEAKDICEKHGLSKAVSEIGLAQVEARRQKKIKENE